MKKLSGKIALITGGTKGIGLATANLFIKEGATVIVCSRHKNNFQNKKMFFHALDVSNIESCEKLIHFCKNKFGKIDILVNNAGIMYDKTTINMSNEKFNAVIDTNLKGTFNITKLVAPIMMDSGYGSIINISSVVADQGNFGQANYVASKAGIEGMTKCWAREFAKNNKNIRVNAVAPGCVLTDIFSNTPKEAIEKLKDKTMLKRLATANEIANVILFLASDDASYITGTVIHVDGGLRV